MDPGVSDYCSRAAVRNLSAYSGIVPAIRCGKQSYKCGITIWARCYRKHVCIFVNSEFYTTKQNDDITKCGIHLVYRGDKVFEQTKLMTAAEYVAASSAIAQVQAKYDQLSLIAQKDTIYKNYARKKGHKRNSEGLSSDNEEEVDLEQLLEKADSSSIPHTMQIRKCQVILTPLESALEDALKKFKAASPTSELSDKEQSEDNHGKTVEESDKNKEQSEDNHKQTVAESDKNKEQSEGSTIVLSGDEDNKESKIQKELITQIICRMMSKRVQGKKVQQVLRLIQQQRQIMCRKLLNRSPVSIKLRNPS